MTNDISTDPKWGSHICVESGQKLVYQLYNDCSQSPNAQFAQSVVEFLAIEGQMAVLVRKQSILIIDTNNRILHSIIFRNGTINESAMRDKFATLNTLYTGEEEEIISSQYRNVAFSFHGYYNDFYVHLFSSDQKQWEAIGVGSLTEPQETVLKPFLQNIYQ